MAAKRTVAKRTQTAAPAAARTLQPRPASLDCAELAALEEEIVAELAPQGALQRSVAENIARNEIEIRTLGARKSLLFWGAAEREMGRRLFRHFDRQNAADCAQAWAAGSPEAAAAIAERDIDPEHALNAAFIETAPIIGGIETQIHRLEHRRRQLQADLRRLQDLARARPEIEDAEVVSDAG